MSKSGILPKSFSFPKLSVPQLVSGSQAEKLFKHFSTTAGHKPEPTNSGAAACGPGLEALLAQALNAAHSALKASLIASHVSRHYGEAQGPSCHVPEPKPPLLEKPVCQPLPLEKTFAGDELLRQLDAGGAAIGHSNGAYGVDSGRCGDVRSEIDPGESLTFHVPSGGRAAGGRVTVDNLFMNGPDLHRQEQGVIEIWDGGRLVKTMEIRGYSSSYGRESIEIDVAFTKLVFKAKGEYKGNGRHSEFSIRDVTVRQVEAPPVQAQPYPFPGDAPPIQAQPYPYPLPHPHPGDAPIKAQPYPYPKPEPYIGIPLFPIAPPAFHKDPLIGSVARGLGRLAEVIDRSRIPENVQNTLLDRIATLLGQIKQPPRDGSHRNMVLVEVASLIKILDENVPRHHGHGHDPMGREHVMNHLRSMLFSVALGRADSLDVTSHVA